jgi:hypothetical protein
MEADLLATALAQSLARIAPPDCQVTANGPNVLCDTPNGGGGGSVKPLLDHLPGEPDSVAAQACQLVLEQIQDDLSGAGHGPWPADGATAHASLEGRQIRLWFSVPGSEVLTLNPISLDAQ